MNRVVPFGLLPAGVVLLGLAAPPAHAIEEMIVTTQKREQSLRDVPLAVSAFDEKLMSQANVEDYRGLVHLTPGFSGATDDGFTDALNIRGISTNDFGIGGDPSVPVFVDGVWEGRSGGAATSFLDIERAEVVRGPQNTLFGRNAIAGAVSITTNRPAPDFAARFSAALEEFNHYELKGTVNVPLGDAWAFRASAFRLDEDGYLTNIAGGHDLGAHTRTAGQAALRYHGSLVDVTGGVYYELRRSDPSVYWSTFPLAPDGSLDPAGQRLPKDKVASDLNAAGQGRDNSNIVRLTLNALINLPADYSLTSTTGFKTYRFFYREDYDATSAPTNNYQQDQNVDYFSQEFRINSPSNRKIVWFAGVSGYSEKVDAIFDNIYDENALCNALAVTEAGDPSTVPDGCATPPPSLVKSERSFNDGRYTGFAAFADATWSVTDRLDLILGGRYSYDRKRMSISVPDSGGALGNNFVWPYFTDGFVSDTNHWSHFNPRLAANFRLNEQWSVYGNVSTGYKAGGFSTFGLSLPADPDATGLVPPGTKPKSFNPEKVVSFEAGTKARLLDNALQANITVYHYKYDDLQNIVFDNGAQITQNVAKANGTGLEVEVRYVPGPLWDVNATAALSYTRIDGAEQSFIDASGCDPKGNELWNTPRLMTNELVTRHFPLASGSEAYVSVEHHYQGSMFGGACNIEQSKVPPYHLFNLRAGYDTGGHWNAAIYLDNVLDRQYFERGWENADANNQAGYGLVNTLVWPSKPRTFGARVEYKF